MSSWLQEHNDEYITFISPTGFRFEFNNLTAMFATVNAIVNCEEVIYTRNNERILPTKAGYLCVGDCDTWTNKQFQAGDYICESNELAKIILNYIADSYYDDSSGKLPKLPR